MYFKDLKLNSWIRSATHTQSATARRSLQNSHLASLRKKKKRKRKRAKQRGQIREKDRCRGVRVCRASGKLRAQNLNSHLASFRRERKKDRKSKTKRATKKNSGRVVQVCLRQITVSKPD